MKKENCPLKNDLRWGGGHSARWAGLASLAALVPAYHGLDPPPQNTGPAPCGLHALFRAPCQRLKLDLTNPLHGPTFGRGCNGSGCNVRIRLQPRLLPTAFTAYCPLYEPMSADRPLSQCLECSLPALSRVISPFTVRSGPLVSWTLLGLARGGGGFRSVTGHPPPTFHPIPQGACLGMPGSRQKCKQHRRAILGANTCHSRSAGVRQFGRGTWKHAHTHTHTSGRCQGVGTCHKQLRC